MPIFHDPFLDNNNKWETRDDEHALLRIEDGDYAYIFENRRFNDYWTTWQPLIIDEQQAYKIHTVLERVSGLEGGYGLIWRCQDEENGFSFEISRNGHYRIRRVRAGKWSTVLPWAPSPYLRLGEKALNELQIVQLPNLAKFYINEAYVNELPFAEMAEGHGFGFIVNDLLRIRIHSTIVLRHIDWEAVPRSPLVVEINEDVQPVWQELNALIGLRNIKQEVRTFINFLKVQKMRQERGMPTPTLTFHMVLAGPPGTGKTTVARMIGRVYKELGLLEKGHVVETDRSGLVASYIGQTAPRVDAMVEKAMGGVLFIDEAYALMPKGEDEGRDFGREAIETLLKRMEDHRGQFAVIIAGYATEIDRFLDANPGVKSRFNRYLYFSHYKPDDLVKIYEKLAGESGVKLTADAKTKLQEEIEKACLVRTDSFGNGRYVRNLLEKSIERQANRIVNITPMTDEVLTTLHPDDIPDSNDE
ncbi:MAG: AAA family ATPase [Chloroflexota bacterium]